MHGAPLGTDEITAARKQLDWPHDPFVLPADVTAAWATIAARGAEARATWAARLETSPNRAAFLAAQGEPDAQALRKAIADHCQGLVADRPKVATRKASEMALEVINATLPQTIGGSANLTGSNLTRSKGMVAIRPGDHAGRYVHYGIREHAMAAVMNGIALHGGFIPYGGTFLAFADYARPAIRLGALMAVRVIHVMTHDSIGLGEDGPTHQPVEHLASLRAISNLQVFRPADAVETAEAWEIALTCDATPSVLALSRQNLPAVRVEDEDTNRSRRGAYVLRATPMPRDVTLIATGSEVEIALAAADLLRADRINAAVVSAPCFELFASQDRGYR